MYYFKDKNNGVGATVSQDIQADVIWITEEEFNTIVKENEIKAEQEAKEEAERATEEDYLAALEVLGVSE